MAVLTRELGLRFSCIRNSAVFSQWPWDVGHKECSFKKYDKKIKNEFYITGAVEIFKTSLVKLKLSIKLNGQIHFYVYFFTIWFISLFIIIISSSRRSSIVVF